METSRPNPADTDAQPRRRPWTPPVLMVLGSVTELTRIKRQNANDGTIFDGQIVGSP